MKTARTRQPPFDGAATDRVADLPVQPAGVPAHEPPAGPLRSYLVVPGEAVEVEARNPREAAKVAREVYPDLREKFVSVVAQSLVWEYDQRRWWK